MNYLEAHKIVNDFVSVIADGCEYENDFFLSTDKLPFQFDKDLIVSAFQIFIYHMVFFNSRTKEEYEKYYLLYQANIDRFLSYSEIVKVRKYYRIMFNKNPIYKIFNKEKIQMASELYGQFMEKNLGGPISYRIDDIFNTNLGEMQGYRQELLKKVKEESDDKIYEAYDKAIELYAIKAYKIANIEWKDEYFYYFQDFKTLRSAANKKEYEKYYLKYKDYIFSNR